MSGNENSSVVNPPSVTTVLKNGSAIVESGCVNILTVMKEGVDKWFDTGPGMPPVHEGNEVEFLIDGPAAFKSMFQAMRTVKNKDHFICFVNWHLDLTINMTDIDENSKETLETYLTKVSKEMNVKIRAIVWDTPLWLTQAENKYAVNAIEKMANGAAFLDLSDRFESKKDLLDRFACHHSKILCVFGEDGLICFCGGVDFNRDRIENIPDSLGSPYNDVHCRIQGPGATDLLWNFKHRWNHLAKDSKFIQPNQFSIPSNPFILNPSANYENSKSGCVVQIGKTFGSEYQYSFAPEGETSGMNMILHGIKSAKEFIYLEEQYFTGPQKELGEALIIALEKIKCLIVLIPHWHLFPSSRSKFEISGRKKMIKKLTSTKNKDKVHIFTLWPDSKETILSEVDTLHGQGTSNPSLEQKFYLKGQIGNSTLINPGDYLFRDEDLLPESGKLTLGDSKPRERVAILKTDLKGCYIHSKTWIFDDDFAIIGSLNTNERSWKYDTEVAAGIFDPNKSNQSYPFAKRLRMMLWKKYLDKDGKEKANFENAVEAVNKFWKNDDFLAGKRVKRYDNDAAPMDLFLPNEPNPKFSGIEATTSVRG